MIGAVAILYLCAPRVAKGAAETVSNEQDAGARIVLNFTRDQTGIASEVRDITRLPDGSLAFVTERGVKLFDGNAWRSTGPGSDLGAMLTTADGRIYDSEGGRIWETTTDERGRRIRHEVTAGLAAGEWNYQRIHSLAVTGGTLLACNGNQVLVSETGHDNRVITLDEWAAGLIPVDDEIFLIGGISDAAITRWNPGTRTFEPAGPNFAPDGLDWFRTWTRRRDGGAWVAAPAGEMFVLTRHGATPWIRETSPEAQEDEITALAELPDGRLVVGTRARGAFIHTPEGRMSESIDEDSGLADLEIKRLFVDPDNGLWVVTRGSVTRRVISLRIVLFGEQHGLAGGVRAVIRGNGPLYVGTDVGLFVSRAASGDLHFDRVAGVDAVSFLLVAQGRVLFTDATGIGEVTPDAVIRFDTIPSSFMIHTPAHPDWVFYDRAETIGALRWNRDHWQAETDLPHLTFRTYGFAADPAGWIWASRGTGRLARFRPGLDGIEIQHLNTSDGVPGRWAVPLIADGAVFVGSTPMYRWHDDTRTFHADPTFHYYPGNPPYGFDQLVRDAHGRAWVAPGSNAGNLLPQPAPVIVSAIVAAGLNIDSRAVALYYDDGDIAWAGGEYGLLRCEQASTPSPPLAARVALHSLRAIEDQQVLLAGANLPQSFDVAHAHRSLRVEATMPEFSSTGFQRFRIYLEGFDRDWGDWTREATRDFTNLPVGTYTLHVQACDAQNREGVPVALTLRIQPPLYRTPLAYLSYVVLLTGSLAGFVRWRLRQLNRQNRDLERSVRDRTREVSHQAELLQQKNHELGLALTQAEALTVEARRRRDKGEIPGQHEPRNPHAHERGDWYDFAARRHPARCGAAGLRAHDPELGREPARRHQRHPRFFETGIGRDRF